MNHLKPGNHPGLVNCFSIDIFLFSMCLYLSPCFSVFSLQFASPKFSSGTMDKRAVVDHTTVSVITHELLRSSLNGFVNRSTPYTAKRATD